MNSDNVIRIKIDSVADFLERAYESNVSDALQSDVAGEYLYVPSDACLMVLDQLQCTIAVTRTKMKDGNYGIRFSFARAGNKPPQELINLPSLLITTDENGITGNPITNGVLHRGRRSSSDKFTQSVIDGLKAGSITCIYAMWLMGWKQEVEIREPQITRQQRRQSERSGKPIDKTKVLYIEPWVRKYRSLSSPSGESKQLPCFTVRGHRAIYTPSNPLFGCNLCRGKGHKDGSTPHVGTFWVAPHFVGNKENGTIEHTYEVAV